MRQNLMTIVVKLNSASLASKIFLHFSTLIYKNKILVAEQGNNIHEEYTQILLSSKNVFKKKFIAADFQSEFC